MSYVRVVIGNANFDTGRENNVYYKVWVGELKDEPLDEDKIFEGLF